VSQNQASHSVALLCETLGVSQSGYYAWRGRPLSRRTRVDRHLGEHIRSAHKLSDGTYGAPRIHAELVDRGLNVGRKRVARLMQAHGVRGVSRSRFYATTRRDQRARPAPDLVERNFERSGPNQLWVGDITHISTWSGPLFLAVVLDAWSRRIVGWAMSPTMTTDLVRSALEMAVQQRQPTNVVHHSDQGSQYTSLEFGGRCRQLGVQLSMGSVGDAYDNAMCESFFATLEVELLRKRTLRTPHQARMEIFRYIEGWYNTQRRHSALGYTSPINYEQKQLTAA
jgi:putative transposase